MEEYFKLDKSKNIKKLKHVFTCLSCKSTYDYPEYHWCDFHMRYAESVEWMESVIGEGIQLE